MNRRKFIKTGTAAASLFAVNGALGYASAPAGQSKQAKHEFNLHYAPHFGTFSNSAGDDPVDQVKFMADVGFTALEDNGMKGRDTSMQEKIAAEMDRRNMKMGVFVAHEIYWNEPNLTSGDEKAREKFLKEIRESVEVAKRVNATWMTVVPGHKDLRKDRGYQTANVVETLRRAAEILEPHGLVMVLEVLNFYNHPGQFLQKMAQGYEICRAVDSPSCKILADIYHQQISEGNLIPNIDMAWDEIGYFQQGDNPGRNEPYTGEINFRNVFKHIYDKGFNGILGMEHGNSISGKKGEKALIDAYVKADNFET
ncbi:MAG: hydroxypyruvate isomerase family protein [Bacteroidales bacterium]